MKYLKKVKTILVFALVIAMVSPVVLPVGNVIVVEAKTKNKDKEKDKAIKLSKKKVTITVGQTFTLEVTGTTGKITWKSSKKKIATVTEDGIVTGVKPGTAEITAKVGNKKYTCKVTVKKAKNTVTNPYTEKTTYESQTATNGKVNYVIPKIWVGEASPQNSNQIVYYSKDADTSKSFSFVLASVFDNAGANKVEYATLKAYLDGINKSSVESLKANGCTDVAYTISDYVYDNGTAIMTDMTYTKDGVTTVAKVYDILVGDYWVELNGNDYNEGVTPAVNTVVLDMLNSLQVSK